LHRVALRKCCVLPRLLSRPTVARIPPPSLSFDIVATGCGRAPHKTRAESTTEGPRGLGSGEYREYRSRCDTVIFYGIRPGGGRGRATGGERARQFSRRENFRDATRCERTTEAANYACRIELSRRFLSSFCLSPHSFFSLRVETTRGIEALRSPSRRKLWSHDTLANADALVSFLSPSPPELPSPFSDAEITRSNGGGDGGVPCKFLRENTVKARARNIDSASRRKASSRVIVKARNVAGFQRERKNRMNFI